ncbi:hypothetical protein TNCV_186311 [Trichonephila clavipes]|nr:hypothetical protein TNCV_186311 [Trichonephila clavipes]
MKVMDSWPACHEFEPCTAEDSPCRRAMHIKSVEAQTFSRWCDNSEKGGASSGVVLVTWPRFKMAKSVAKSPRVAE